MKWAAYYPSSSVNTSWARVIYVACERAGIGQLEEAADETE